MITDLDLLEAIHKGSLWLKWKKLVALGFISGGILPNQYRLTTDGEKEIEHLRMDSPKLREAVSLIQDARARALTGEYGQQDVEYTDVKERFDQAIEILQAMIEETSPSTTKTQ